MNLVSAIAALALLEYLVIQLLTGRARATYGVKAPATVGDPIFERYYRVQQNSVEQLIVFIPSLFLFANYVSPRIAALLGLTFIIGRAIYARSYIADPETRGTGFLIGFVSLVILLLGGFIGAIVA